MERSYSCNSISWCWWLPYRLLHVNITQTWFNDTDNRPEGKKAIQSLFIDFSKAFDLVDHSILLSKLKTGASASHCGYGQNVFFREEHRAPVAQFVKHRAAIREVVSSTPAGPALRVFK